MDGIDRFQPYQIHRLILNEKGIAKLAHISPGPNPASLMVDTFDADGNVLERLLLAPFAYKEQ